MDDRTVRVALERHWDASDASDFKVEHEIYREDAVLDYPQSGERIAVESPITNCLAAARAAAPPSTTWITRTRRSFEYPIAGLLYSRRPQNLIRGSL
jgi:hypothetical protein